VIALRVLTVLAALVLGALGVTILADPSWISGDVKVFRWEVDHDVLGAFFVVIAVLLATEGLIAASRGRAPGPRHETAGACPSCGRPVVAGSPTCLGCGCNLVRASR
jgi:hypothetical protein